MVQHDEMPGERHWQRHELYKAFANAVANNLVSATIALTVSVFAVIHLGVGQWLHAPVAAWLVAGLIGIIVGISGFVLGAAYCVALLGYFIKSGWNNLIHQPTSPRVWWRRPFDTLSVLGIWMTATVWYNSMKQRELLERMQSEAAQASEPVQTLAEANARIAALERELATLHAKTNDGD